MKMPVNYVVEMYIDRVAASKNYQKEKYRDDSALAYYMNGRQFHVLHDDTRALLELLLEMLAIKGEKVTNRFIREEVLSHKIPYEKEPLLQLKEQLEKDHNIISGKRACISSGKGAVNTSGFFVTGWVKRSR